MADNVQIMTNDNYQDMIQNSKKLIVDVWAPWCSPCKRSTPVFEEMASIHASDEIIFAKLDTQANQSAGKQLRIMSLPTFLVFENGDMKKKWTGADIGRLRKEIDDTVKN